MPRPFLKRSGRPPAPPPMLRGVTALVSGGGSGLGAAVSRRIVEGGGRVLISDVNEAAGAGLAGALGPSAVFARTDCTSESEVEQALDLAESAFGCAISAAVSTAGVAAAAKTVNAKGKVHPLGSFESTLRVNVLGTFNVARLAAQRMAARQPDPATGERGVIVNTASIAAFDGQAGQVAYAASKGAVVGMTLPMARDLAPLGIRVCTVAPGIFDTPMMAAAPDAVREGLAASIPFPSRFGQPDEFAALVESLLLNSYLNGEVVRLDGAVRMASS